MLSARSVCSRLATGGCVCVFVPVRAFVCVCACVRACVCVLSTKVQYMFLSKAACKDIPGVIIRLTDWTGQTL